MKFIYVTDLHGHRDKYERILEIAIERKVNAVINGGDMLDKSGEHLHDCQKESLEWLDKHLDEYTKSGIIYFGMLGNDDLRIFNKSFNSLCAMNNIAERAYWIRAAYDEEDRITIKGFNWVVDYPFALKDRVARDCIGSHIYPYQYGSVLSTKTGFKKIEDWESYSNKIPTIEERLKKTLKGDLSNTICVIHNPPFDTGLDTLYDGKPVGSLAVKNFIKEKQPLLTLHGHIHESPQVSGKWITSIGETICIQPGQGDSNNIHYVIIDTDNLHDISYFQDYIKKGDSI